MNAHPPLISPQAARALSVGILRAATRNLTEARERFMRSALDFASAPNESNRATLDLMASQLRQATASFMEAHRRAQHFGATP